jgi:Mg2+ and Co2+ transporter CorA
MNARLKARIRKIAKQLIQSYGDCIRTFTDASTAARFADLIEQAQTSREDLQWYLRRLDTEDDWLELFEECERQQKYMHRLLNDTDSLIAEIRAER